jgi:RNA polymerase sigma factor (sigma-70 family)
MTPPARARLAPGRVAADSHTMTPILSATLLRTQSDARLAMLTRQGHERAFEAIVERYRRVLHRYVRRMLPESRTEDALQQTFIKAWSALSEGGVEVKDLKPWLYRIAHNTALDALKKAGYDYDELQESLRSPDAPDADLERRTVMRETLAGVAALPDRQREALLRVAVEGQSRAQVAHDLGLTDGAVRQLVHRARMTLRAAATAVTPLPFAAWAAAARQHKGPVGERVAELAAGGGAAGGAGLLFTGGAVIVAASALAVGPSALKQNDQRPAEASATTKAVGPASTAGQSAARTGGATGGDAAGQVATHGRSRGASSRRGVRGRGPRPEDNGRGGPGGRPAGEDHSGSGSGADRSGPGGGDRSGSSGSGSGSGDRSGSLSGSGGDGVSGGGSGTSGSGSGGSGSASSGPSGGSGGGTSGSGSGDRGSGGSGSGGSGSGDLSGSGSGDGSPDPGH